LGMVSDTKNVILTSKTISIFLEIQKEWKSTTVTGPFELILITASSLYKKNCCYGYLNRDKRE
jgi:hypothetical protein